VWKWIFPDWWDKWPGQYDPYVSAARAYHAERAPWREVLDQKASRMVIRSNMAPVDYSYGLVDILRVSEDADQGYEDLESAMSETEFTGLFAETVGGSAIGSSTTDACSGTMAMVFISTI